MGNTQEYREQHEMILTMASEISNKLQNNILSKDAREVRTMLANLFGKLKYHLVIEDKSLYPRLLENPNEKIKNTAKEFINEMGSIAKAIDAYSAKWSNGQVIQKDIPGFIDETKGLFKALLNRIERENNVLYKLVDDLT